MPVGAGFGFRVQEEGRRKRALAEQQMELMTVELKKAMIKA
ncbi:hypothetical protein [Rhizobium sp. Nf11,1]